MVPVNASLNAVPRAAGPYARLIQNGGADRSSQPLPLAADPGRTAGDMEAVDLDLIAAVRAATTIPLAVKLSPYYSALAGFARRALEHGADGMVLFNRVYPPDLELETHDVGPRLELSKPWELACPSCGSPSSDPNLAPACRVLAATSGIHAGTDAVKALMGEPDVAMSRRRPAPPRAGAPRHDRSELRRGWRRRNTCPVAQLRGSASQAAVGDPSAFERANYMKTLRSWATPGEPRPRRLRHSARASTGRAPGARPVDSCILPRDPRPARRRPFRPCNRPRR